MATNESGLGEAFAGLVNTGFQAIQSGLSEAITGLTSQVFGSTPSKSQAAQTAIKAGKTVPLSPAQINAGQAAQVAAGGVGAGFLLLIGVGVIFAISRR